MSTDARTEAVRLLLEERWACLAVAVDGAPAAGMVAFAAERDLSALYLHLSPMAQHTQGLLEDARCALAATRPDTGTGDPQTLPRVTLRGRAEALEPASAAWVRARAVYLERFPAAEERFELPDFLLFRLVPEEARYVGGFARALRLSGEQLVEAARRPA